MIGYCLLLPAENEDNYEESDFFEDLIDEILFEEDFEIPNPVLKLKKKREVNSHFNVDKKQFRIFITCSIQNWTIVSSLHYFDVVFGCHMTVLRDVANA